MKYITEWNESKCKDIARKSLSKQAVKDVSYARFAFFHGGNKQKHICLILDNKAFILGMIHKNGARIIGLAVDVDYQNNGIGGSLLKAFESIALQHGKQKCYIRTFDGIQFFEKHGYNVIDIAKNGKDLILEKWIK